MKTAREPRLHESHKIMFLIFKVWLSLFLLFLRSLFLRLVSSFLLERLDLDHQNWLYLSTQFESHFRSIIGTAHTARQACEKLGKRWAHGIQPCEILFSSRYTLSVPFLLTNISADHYKNDQLLPSSKKSIILKVCQ